VTELPEMVAQAAAALRLDASQLRSLGGAVRPEADGPMTCPPA